MNGRIFLQMVKERNKRTPQGIIKAHTEVGTTIFTDSWKSYDSLPSQGLEHFKVNHKKCFVSCQRRAVPMEEPMVEVLSDDAEDADDIELIDDTIVVHTNKIERSWREIKRGLSNQPISLLSRNIGVEMFRFNHLGTSIPFVEKRNIVLRTIAKHQEKIDKLLQSTFPVYPEEP